MVIKSLVSKDGKNLEKQIMLSNIIAPRLGRRTNPQSADSVTEPDQVIHVIIVMVVVMEFLRLSLLCKNKDY